MTTINDDFVILDRDDVSDYNDANILPESPASRENIIEWLAPTSFNSEGSEYRKHLSSHLAGTGAWLTSTEAYRQWHDSTDNGLLWIKGIPGSGKSVFAASLAEKLANEGTPVLFFFFRQIIDANHDPVSLLRDWLCQTLLFSPPLQAKLSSYVKGRRDLRSLSMDDLWKDLRLALSHQPRVYVIADALDEMDSGNDAFLTALAELGSWRPDKVKVLMTSRPVNTVEIPLRNIHAVQIRLEEHLVDVDITTYVTHRLRDSTIADDDRASVREAVPGRANGLFLYAKLAMDAFLEPGANVREVLEELPADLNVMYTDLLREHGRRSGVPHEVQLHIMQWVTHATRPLRLLELAEMINVTFHDGSNRDLKAAKALVRATCGPLIEILPDETVSVVHHSLTEFLKGSTRTPQDEAKTHAYPILRPGPTNARLALSCLQYLQSGCLDDWEVKPRSELDDWHNPRDIIQGALKMRFPFIAYATENWHVHAVKAADNGASPGKLAEISVELDSFLQPGPRLNAWLDIGCPSLPNQGVTALHVAGYTGLTGYVTLLVARPSANMNATDNASNTPLHYAANEGNSGAVKVLLAHGAHPDPDNAVGLKPLHQAASNNKAEVVKLLLEAGVDPLTPKTKETGERRCGNAPSSVGHTPLMYACQNGHEDVVAEFLPYLKLETVHQALSWAASSGHAKVVAIVLQHPDADANFTYRGDSALFNACKTLDRDTIEVLLNAGADPNQRCESSYQEFGGIYACSIPRGGFDSESYKRGYTPMDAFAGLNRRSECREDTEAVVEIFHLLMKNGGKIDCVDRNGNTPLHYACSRNGMFSHDGKNLRLVQLLLDAGADANVASDRGETPLHLSINDSSGETTRLLVEQGNADINKMDSEGRTPLVRILSSFNFENSLRFLQYGSDCGLTDQEGNGPLHMVTKNVYGSVFRDGATKADLVKGLLAAGADPMLKNGKGQTAMHVLQYENVHLLSVLLEAGCELEARDHDGRTVLHHVVGSHCHKKQEHVQKLIEVGARTDCRDFNGRTLLHEAIKVGDMNTLQVLLDRGESCKDDYAGNSLHHELARISGKTSFHKSKNVELPHGRELVSLGLNPDQENNSGCTPLHIVSALTPDSPARMDHMQPIDIWLQVCKKVNAANHHGVTPLHLASTSSQYNANGLIKAGADVHAATSDGLTPLHVAARCRQSNIVGILLEHLETANEKKTLVNAKDNSGCTALHYACMSGRHETAIMLIDAGADVNEHDKYGVTPLAACAEFEEEQELWERHGSRGFWCNVVIPPVLGFAPKEPRYRPWIRSRRDGQRFSAPEQDTARLEEIIDLLIAKGADLYAKGEFGQSLLDSAIGKNADKGHDYTAACFTRLQDSVSENATKSAKPSFSQLWAKKRNAAAESALEESQALESCKTDGYYFQHWLDIRQFHLVEHMVKAGMRLSHGQFHHLARWGYARLLTSIGNLEAELRLENSESSKQWESYRDGSVSDPNEESTPILIAACERELPNMEVVKILVEQHEVNIDARSNVRVYRDGYHMVLGGSALHHLACGTQWWHVAQALPYLLNVGADPETRNEDGCTPLHVAIDASSHKTGCFHTRAAQILVEHGADVNAIDDDGRSCLAKAGGDCDLIRLLIRHGARVTASAIFATIDNRNCDALKALLSQDADPNQRRPKLKADENEECRLSDRERRQRATWDDGMDDHEWYPLHYAALHFKDGGCNSVKDANSKQHRQLSIDLVRILLAHGADPYRTFNRRIVDSDLPCQREEELEECTVVHEVIESAGVVQPFLELQDLEVDRRNADGRTLFLAACGCRRGPDANRNAVSDLQESDDSRPPSFAMTLLARGADICATDRKGWNALHVMLGPDTPYSKRNETIKMVINRAPQLINDKNQKGETPFHHALQLDSSNSIVEQLLEAGADPQLPDSNGNNALFYLSTEVASAHERAKDLFQRFLALGLSINSRNKLGETPLFWFFKACPHGTKSMFDDDLNAEETYKTLLPMYTAAGASVFDRDTAGQTLLHIVATKRYNERFSHFQGDQAGRVAELFKYLMELGLDPMAEDGQQRTSLDVAAACGNERVLKLFERSGRQKQ